MENKTSYDLLTVNTEQKLMDVLNNSGLTITTISLITDKLKNNIDVQKYKTINEIKLQEEKNKTIDANVKNK